MRSGYVWSYVYICLSIRPTAYSPMAYANLHTHRPNISRCAYTVYLCKLYYIVLLLRAGIRACRLHTSRHDGREKEKSQHCIAKHK